MNDAVDDAIEKLLCVCGRPRTGTTSATGEIGRSPLYRLWVEKDLWIEQRSYGSMRELLCAAQSPGGKIQMASLYNTQVVARKSGCTVLGDKTTWSGPGACGRDAVEQILDNLSRTAGSLGVAHEMVICVRDPVTWVPAWAVTHFMWAVGPSPDFWEAPQRDATVRDLMASKMAEYESHLRVVLALSRSSAVTVRCMEMTPPEGLYYRFDLGEYIDQAAPLPFRMGQWKDLVSCARVRLEDAVRSGWLDSDGAARTYGSLVEVHRPLAVSMGDGTTLLV